MTFKIDESLHWTDHYVKYGFAAFKGLVDRSWCDRALDEVRRIVGDDQPLTEWVNDRPGKYNLTDAHPGQWHYPFFQGPGRTGWTPQNPVLETLYNQPRLKAALDRMHGDPDAWDGARNYYIFLNPYNPEAGSRIAPKGHIDFKAPIPALYRGFTFQIALVDTEPFSGNTTIYPGTHVPVQKALMADRDRDLTQAAEAPTGSVEPYEFVAEAGDVLFMHHLVYHSGNPSHSPNRKPRLGLHAESFRKTWLTEIDPDKPGLSPWERSLALNGSYQANDEAAQQRKQRKEFIEQIEKERGIQIDEKWKHLCDWPRTAPV